MNEVNTVERPVMPVAWMSLRDRFYKTRMMAVENCEQLVTALYALTPEQVAVLEKYAADKAWAARDLSKCKCDHNETCEHCYQPNLRHNAEITGG